MRRPIGWVDKNWEGGKREVKVEFFAGGLRWRFKTAQDEEWQDGTPTEENWDDLEVKLRELIQRGHLFDRELTLVKKLRKGDTLPVSIKVSEKELRVRNRRG
ncbi:MAG: hypothetical protein J6S21_01020 [Victivallales bacterium]|jgi:hypothetical protein|nr:hypothetical protein [Victivallales bacterium]